MVGCSSESRALIHSKLNLNALQEPSIWISSKVKWKPYKNAGVFSTDWQLTRQYCGGASSLDYCTNVYV
jgi:hypothetical protein